MKNTYWLVCLAILSTAACKNDRKYKEPLLGRWELTFGELNGQPAPSLEKIFFEFNEDSMKTNFTLSEQEEMGSFKLKDSVLTQNTAEPIRYDIESLSDSSMELSTALRGLDFKLYLKKAGNAAAPVPPQ